MIVQMVFVKVGSDDARYPYGHIFSSFFAGLPKCRFSVPAPESYRSVVSLSLFTQEVLAKSYPIQPVIQL